MSALATSSHYTRGSSQCNKANETHTEKQQNSLFAAVMILYVKKS